MPKPRSGRPLVQVSAESISAYSHFAYPRRNGRTGDLRNWRRRTICSVIFSCSSAMALVLRLSQLTVLASSICRSYPSLIRVPCVAEIRVLVELTRALGQLRHGLKGGFAHDRGTATARL